MHKCNAYITGKGTCFLTYYLKLVCFGGRNHIVSPLSCSPVPIKGHKDLRRPREESSFSAT